MQPLWLFPLHRGPLYSGFSNTNYLQANLTQSLLRVRVVARCMLSIFKVVLALPEAGWKILFVALSGLSSTQSEGD